jgi:hypothetical protein
MTLSILIVYTVLAASHVKTSSSHIEPTSSPIEQSSLPIEQYVPHIELTVPLQAFHSIAETDHTSFFNVHAESAFKMRDLLSSTLLSRTDNLPISLINETVSKHSVQHVYKLILNAINVEDYHLISALFSEWHKSISHISLTKASECSMVTRPSEHLKYYMKKEGLLRE